MRWFALSACFLALATSASVALAQDAPPPEGSPSPTQQAEPQPEPERTWPQPATFRERAEPAPTETPTPVATPAATTAPISVSYRHPPGTASGRVAFDVGNGLVLQPGLELFARYAVVLTPRTGAGLDWFHRFDMPRAHASLSASWQGARARVVLEGVSSASAGALLGVAGDSFVLRVREAWVGYDFTDFIGTGRAADGLDLEIRAGIVPTTLIPAIEGTWALRAVAPTPLEESGLAAPADLGVTAHLVLPGRYGFVALGAFNGDGYAQRELNRGKNLEATAEIHPLAFEASLAPLAVVLAYVDGSVGTASARASRITAGLVWRDPRFGVGALFTYALGLADDGAREGYLLDVFVRGEPVDNLLLGARLTQWSRDNTNGADSTTNLVFTAGYRVAPPLEVFLAAQGGLPGSVTLAALPDSNTWTLSAVGRAIF